MENNIKTVVLARGTSLSKINRLNDIDINQAIIINRFYAELSNRNIFNFLLNKDVVHMLAIQNNPPCQLPKKMYRKLNIKYCIVNRTKKQCDIGGKLTDYMDDHPAKLALENYDINMDIRYLPEDIDDIAICEADGKGLQSTGLLAIAYATHYLNSNDVYIIGLDFHDVPYYAPQYSTMKSWDPRKPKVINRMKIGFEEWVRKTPNVKYHILTDSQFRFNAPNIEWIE